MRLIEITVGFIAIVVITLNLLGLGNTGVILVLTFGFLSTLYFYFGFALFNGIRFRKIFKKKSYSGISPFRLIGAILTGIVLSIVLIGILFKFQSYPGSTIMIFIGLVSILPILIIGLIKFQKTKSKYYTRVLIRILVYGTVGLSLILIPKETWLEIRFKEYPDYIKAQKEHWADPENRELHRQAEEERIKTYKKE